MLDLYGFPRRAETIGVSRYGWSPWRVFWSVNPIRLTAAGAMILPAPSAFPGRYFLTDRSEGMPSVAAATFSVHSMPVLRFFAATAANAAVSLVVANRRDHTSSLLSITLSSSGAGTVSTAQGCIYLNDQATLAEVHTVVDNVPATTTATSTGTWGGQDLWFYLSMAATAQVVGFSLEYADFPL